MVIHSANSLPFTRLPKPPSGIAILLLLIPSCCLLLAGCSSNEAPVSFQPKKGNYGWNYATNNWDSDLAGKVIGSVSNSSKSPVCNVAITLKVTGTGAGGGESTACGTVERLEPGESKSVEIPVPSSVCGLGYFELTGLTCVNSIPQPKPTTKTVGLPISNPAPADHPGIPVSTADSNVLDVSNAGIYKQIIERQKLRKQQTKLSTYSQFENSVLFAEYSFSLLSIGPQYRVYSSTPHHMVLIVYHKLTSGNPKSAIPAPSGIISGIIIDSLNTDEPAAFLAKLLCPSDESSAEFARFQASIRNLKPGREVAAQNHFSIKGIPSFDHGHTTLSISAASPVYPIPRFTSVADFQQFCALKALYCEPGNSYEKGIFNVALTNSSTTWVVVQFNPNHGPLSEIVLTSAAIEDLQQVATTIAPYIAKNPRSIDRKLILMTFDSPEQTLLVSGIKLSASSIAGQTKFTITKVKLAH